MVVETRARPTPLSGSDDPPLAVLPEAHPTAVVYLDESGVIKTDRFFGIGCLKVTDGPELTRALWRQRQVLEYTDELHWSAFDKAAALNGPSFDMALAALDIFFQLDGTSFCCMLADRQKGDLTKSYQTASLAYEGLSSKVLNAAIDGPEVVSVLADHADAPRGVRFEEGVKAGVNRGKGRLAIATVTRAHSHAVDGLQLVDLLLGAAMFDFRQGAAHGGLREDTQKGRLCRHLLNRCDIASFRPHGKQIPGKIGVELRRRRPTRRGRRGGDPT